MDNLEFFLDGKTSRGDREATRLLIEAGADIDFQNEHGGVALMVEVFRDRYGADATMWELIIASVDINIDFWREFGQIFDGNTALIMAAYRGYTEVVRELIEGFWKWKQLSAGQRKGPARLQQIAYKGRDSF